MAFILPILILAVLWVFILLPQQRRLKEHRAFIATLAVGDDVVTTSGLYGTIVTLDEATVGLRIADGVEVTVARMAIAHGQPDPDDDSAAPDEFFLDADDRTE